MSAFEEDESKTALRSTPLSGEARSSDSLVPGLATERIAGGVWHSPMEFFERILDTLPDPVFVKDQQHRWVAFNQAFCHLLGQARATLFNKSDFDFFPEEEARTFWKQDELAFNHGGVLINEEPLTDAAGATHILVTKKTVFFDAEGKKFLVGVIRDVTEQKRAEEALRRARDELEERVLERTREVEAAQAHLRQAQKMEAVGQLTGGVAHDFNNLLAVIMGNVELAQRNLPKAHPARQAIDGALAAAERGAMLTHRLLAFSRRQALKPVPTDVNALIADILEILRRTLGETVALRTSLGPIRTTLVDAVQLETALLNLAINARDAMPQGGELCIDTTLARLDERFLARGEEVIPGEYVKISVSDNGCGMDRPVVDRVFEPFYTTKDTGKGSGLGLSMVYGFVRQSRGHVQIQSEVGVGTTVDVYLPCTREPPAAWPPSPAPGGSIAPVSGHHVVMVVEDDPLLRRVAMGLLEALGYRARSAEDAPEALQALEQDPVLDLLITDVILPKGINGFELARRARERIGPLPVVFMSGYTADALAPDSALEPDLLLLKKPFRQQELQAAIEKSLGLSRTGD